MSARTYTMQESDLDEHWRDWSGRFWHPSKIGVALCTACDSIIIDGDCPSCATEALLDLTVQSLGGGTYRTAA